jgi:zinc transport system ATP-binding protein
MNAIDWDDICFAYDGHIVLHPSSFSIPHGKLVGIMGPNGGGKTTLLKLLMGFLKPLKGKIQIFGKPPVENYPNIGYVPQFSRSDRDFPITLEEVVGLGSSENGSKWIEKLKLEPHRKKRFGELSGGLAQRTLLARALASDPTLLLLDEPTANIDPPSAAAILDLLDSLKGAMTILLVTHDVKTVIERVELILSVQGKIQKYLPKEVCEHFAMGLYHTPLLDLPTTHWRNQ